MNLDRADFDVLEVFGAGDLFLVRLTHQQLLAGHVVGTRLANYLAAVISDGIRGEHEVDLACFDERLPVVGDRLLPGDAVVLDTECTRNDAAHLDIETLWIFRTGLEEADARLVVLDPDGDLARLGELRHGRVLGKVGLGVDVYFDVLRAGLCVVAAGRQGQGQYGPDGECFCPDEAHGLTPVQ